uniref:AAA family ATPase n=1 Tax=Allorhizocola rhizosphaerae TaxID=1872709 RepID=UPI000E3E5E9B
MTRMSVQTAPAATTNYGSCYVNDRDIPAGCPVRVAANGATIFCVQTWDLHNRFQGPDRIILDRWQCDTLSVQTASPVEVERLDPTGLASANMIELSLVRWSGTPGENRAGLLEFLRGGRYLLYPGLRFGYRALGGQGLGEYKVESVRANCQAVPVAAIGERVTVRVRRPPGVTVWPPTYDDVGGLDQAIALLRREVEVPLRRPADLAAIGVAAPTGVLLYGPPGTGKTLLARAVAFHSGVPTTLVSGPEIAGRPPAEAETLLRNAFGDAHGPPRIVILDDVDYLAPERSQPAAGPSMVSLLQRLLDQPGRPVVIGTTSRRDAIDPAIRRLGRLGRQVAVGVPNESDRREIIMVHTRELALAFNDQERHDLAADLARRTAGFVGADLEALCHEAGRVALRRAFPLEVLESAVPVPQTPLEIELADWQEALTLVTPSAIGSVVSEIPPVTFADVAALASSTLLCCVVECAVADVACAGDDHEYGLQEPQDGVEGQAGASTFGSRR